jgi:aromatic-L-amino-acid decarboxylase
MSSPSRTPDQDWAGYIADFRRAAHQAVDWAAEYLEHVRDYPVVPRLNPGDLTDCLPRSAPDRGESFDDILRDFDAKILPAVTHWNHPRFMAYFANSGASPAIIAEMLSATLNTNGLHWKTSPAVAELEQVALGWLRQWMGLSDDYFGIIYDTASVASLHAVACAREMADPAARVNGSTPNLVLYTSQESHSSIEKAAICLGIGQKNVRKVPADDAFRMDVQALEAMIKKDLAAGLRPFCVVATVGTTSSTSVDPVAKIADVAEQHKLWLHIDAAYAGIAAILPECRDILEGNERAHSLVVNPHKWMFTPVDLSAFYTRYPDILRRAFSLSAEYLYTADNTRQLNLMDYGVPLGRRFRSLKLWFLMRYFGRERVQQLLRNHIGWAQKLAKLIEADSRFEIAAPHPFSVVCFRYKGSDAENKAILEAANASGEVYLSSTVLKGKVVLRVAIGNLQTTWEDVNRAWELLKEATDKR